MIKKNNEDIRNAIHSAGLHNYQVADALGLSESYFCKALRRELPDYQKVAMLDIIENLSNGGATCESMQALS